MNTQKHNRSVSTWTSPLLCLLLVSLGAWFFLTRNETLAKTTTEVPVENGHTELAVLGGGCFWCVEAALQSFRGVGAVRSGYAGGTVVNPTYEQVSTGTTGHAEVVEVSFNPAEISYAQLLEIFFSAHDPTTKNAQGNDVGPQYRSVIFTMSDEQASTARAVIARLTAEKLWSAPIVTEVLPLSTFYLAEEYHQNYYQQNPNQMYCSIVIAPKLQKLFKKYGALLRKNTP